MPTVTVSESDPVTSALHEPRRPAWLLAGAVLEVVGDRDGMGPAARARARRFDSERYAEPVERLPAA